MMDFIERMRAKPEQVRRRFAFIAASSLTGVVAFGWGVAFLAGGALAAGTSAPASTLAATAPSTPVAGAASAFLGAWGTLTGKDASITVVQTHASSTLDEKPAEERTVIPF